MFGFSLIILKGMEVFGSILLLIFFRNGLIRVVDLVGIGWLILVCGLDWGWWLVCFDGVGLLK